jgi:hypothetical protein
MEKDNKAVSMSGLKADSYHLTPTLIKKLLKGGRNTLLKKGQILDGVGALFIGNPPGRSKQALTFLIKEADTGLLADLGGRYDPHHKNSIEVLQDEVYEESAKTLQIVALPNGHLILNQKIDLTEHPGIVLDTFGHRGNKVYRVFVFDIGNEYTSDIFNPAMLRRSHKLLVKEKVDPKYLETTDGQHITLRSIKMCLDKGEDCKVSNMNRCTGELRPRTARIFHILFRGSL